MLVRPRGEDGNSKWKTLFARNGGPMKVVHRSKAKALKGNRSRSFQLVGPDSTGARKFMITVVHVRPGGSTPLHEHKTVESMYYILEGRAEVSSGKE